MIEKKIRILQLLGCSITEDSGRHYAKGEFIQKYYNVHHWHNIKNIVFDWNLVMEFARKIYTTEQYNDVATFFDDIFLKSLEAETIPEETATNLINAIDEDINVLNYSNLEHVSMYTVDKLLDIVSEDKASMYFQITGKNIHEIDAESSKTVFTDEFLSIKDSFKKRIYENFINILDGKL